MIKKNTKIIIEDEKGNASEWLGGLPLSVGEIIHLHADKTGTAIDYKVTDKTVDCYLEGEDQVVNIVYKLSKV
ncbi:MAG: hypothetical protein NTX82_02230 [Candidatus Parcubacteria bacterium]|nr:hypothetical protein [Candidatus Parcubacteria bacterium]